METKNPQKPSKKAQILMRKCQNIVQLCEQKEEDGSNFHYVKIEVGKSYFWVSFDEMKEIMYQFESIVNLKRTKKQ